MAGAVFRHLLSALQVDYLRAWMALVRPLPTAGATAAAAAAAGAMQQVDAALAIAKAVVSRYADVAAQVSHEHCCRMLRLPHHLRRQEIHYLRNASFTFAQCLMPQPAMSAASTHTLVPDGEHCA